jgi:two-component system, OmpR family, response regulator
VSASPCTILVAVRDVDVRALILRILSASFWNVLSAATERDALDLAGSAELDLLVVEASPAVDGSAIAERLRLRAPGLPVVYVTAWYSHPDFAHLKSEHVVREPFSRDELMAAIAAALGRAGAT